jgi:hypothetical protein
MGQSPLYVPDSSIDPEKDRDGLASDLRGCTGNGQSKHLLGILPSGVGERDDPAWEQTRRRSPRRLAVSQMPETYRY